MFLLGCPLTPRAQPPRERRAPQIRAPRELLAQPQVRQRALPLPVLPQARASRELQARRAPRARGAPQALRIAQPPLPAPRVHRQGRPPTVPRERARAIPPEPTMAIPPGRALQDQRPQAIPPRLTTA